MQWLQLLVLLLCPAAAVGSAYIEQLQAAALAQDLDTERGWRALGHYRQATLFNGVISEADDATFFFAAEGKQDPRAELLATLAAFEADGSGDEHPQCRFPARYFWLKSRLGFDAAKLPEQSCPAFTEWRRLLAARAATLVFPASYLNSPSSMFGHTFLRLDQAGQNEANLLLAYTVNYAADAAARDNELAFAYKGIFGGYPGIVSVQPYYQKVKEYSDWENRDIWEYRLNLGPAEIDQLLRHVWEIQGSSRFDYFFFDENCSYRLLGLLEVARPELDLLRDFRLRAIPADTVRAVIAAGLVTGARYRPASATLLKDHVAQLDPSLRRLALRLAQTDEAVTLAGLAPERRAAALEVAYEYLRYRVLDEKLPRQDETVRRSHRLLLERSRLGLDEVFEPLPVPRVRDDQGHETARLAVALGVREHRSFWSLQLRSAYHDLTDPWPGYQLGARITFLDATLRWYERGLLQLEDLTVLNISSLSGRDRFLHPVSWSVGLGARRKLFGDQRFLSGYLEAGGGVSYRAGEGLVFAMLEPKLELSDQFQQRYSLGLGAHLGWLYRGLGGQGEVGLRYTGYWAGDDHHAASIRLEHSVNLGRDHALRLRFEREKSKGGFASDFSLAFQTYF